MSKRRRKQKKTNKKAASRRPGLRKKSSVEPQNATSWKAYAAVIIGALALFAIFIATQFDPIDRLMMVGFSGICVGLGLFIVGTITAVGKFPFDESSRLGTVLAWLAALATPERRWGEIFYSSKAIYHVFEKILIALILPIGFVFALTSPKKTWPAVLWVVGGVVAICMGVSICYTQRQI